jgi:hypothetical protein
MDPDNKRRDSQIASWFFPNNSPSSFSSDRDPVAMIGHIASSKTVINSFHSTGTATSEIKISLIALLMLLAVNVSSCKKSAADRENARDSTRVQSSSTKSEESVIRFRMFKYVDAQGIGIEAFRVLIPFDWKFEGGVRWVLDNPGMPAVVSFRMFNPNGAEELEVFPNQAFFWTDNPTLLQTFPVGARYFGNEVRPIVKPLQALKGIILPRFRGKAEGLRIVAGEPLPDLPKSLGAGTQTQPGVATTAEGAKIRIQYQRNGKWMEEELYGLVESMSFPHRSMFGQFTNTYWYADYLFSFKAEKGKLDANSKLFQAMVASFRLNPQWFNKYNQVIEYLIQRQIQQIRSIGELSRIISRTQNEISDMMMQSYNQRQEVYDRVAENFSQHIRGVDQYYNPVEQKPVELPSGYRQAWTNSLGEYILSDQEDFNPNIGSNQTWQKMERK